MRPRGGRSVAGTISLAAVLSLGVAGATSGCGSSDTNPPPAEPEASPPLGPKPAGTVLRLGAEAEGVVVDGVTGLAAVALRDPDRIDLIDVGRAEVVDELATPNSARHLSLAAPGGPVLVPVEYEDTLLEVELPKGAITPKPTGDFPHDAAVADNGRTFVANEGGDTISVLDGDETVDTLPAPEQPGGVAVSGNVLGVVAVAAREVAFYDTDTLEQLAVEPGGAGPSHVVAGEDGRFYVTDTGGDAILVYEGLREDGEPPRLLDRTNLAGSPYGIAIDERRERLWVTRTAANRVVELEITESAPKIIDSFPTVSQPNSVGVDERTGEVVIAGREGDLQIFDPELEGDTP